MPLNSERLPKDVRNFLHELPLDKDCADTKDVYYQTKVEIFESECKDCDFVRVILKTYGDDNRQKITVLDGKGAIEKTSETIAKYLKCEITRTCTYPQDIRIKNDVEIYPTLSEIVTNTCQFWHIDKLNIPSDKETAFIVESEQQEEVERLIDERAANIIRERISQE